MLAQNTVTNFGNVASTWRISPTRFSHLLCLTWFIHRPSIPTRRPPTSAGECAFVQALLKRAPGRIQIVEFINEPGGGYHWVPQCQTWQDIATFTAKLATAVRAAVRAIDSTNQDCRPIAHRSLR